MTLKDLLADSPDNSLSGIKWHTLKQSIVKCLLSIGDATILELSTELQSSIPTISKAINELLGGALHYIVWLQTKPFFLVLKPIARELHLVSKT